VVFLRIDLAQRFASAFELGDDVFASRVAREMSSPLEIVIRLPTPSHGDAAGKHDSFQGLPANDDALSHPEGDHVQDRPVASRRAGYSHPIFSPGAPPPAFGAAPARARSG
jgi:hypothetical protein